MFYIVFGEQEFLVNRTIKKIEKKYNEIEYFDFKEDDLNSIIKSISSYSLFEQKKLIEIKNFDLLLKSDEELEKNKKSSEFISYLFNSSDNDIILIVLNKKISHNKIYKKIYENGEIYENLQLSDDDWRKYIKQRFNKENIEIAEDAIEELIVRVEKDLTKFENEFNKLINYSNKINLNDIKILVSEPLEENSFLVLNYLINDNKIMALKKYNNLLKQNYETVVLISSIVTQLVFYQQVYYLNNFEKKSNLEIAKILKSNDKRVYVTLKNLKKMELSNIHVFPYSLRKNTKAALLSGHVEMNEKKKRADILHKLAKKKFDTFAEKNIGQTAEVLVEKNPDRKTGLLKGVTKNYLNVYLECTDKTLCNTIQKVRIVKFEAGKLFCNIIEG